MSPRSGAPRSGGPRHGGPRRSGPQSGAGRSGGPREGAAAGDGPGAHESSESAVQPARRVALDVIRAVNADDAYANLLLPARVRRAGLNTADAALATELTYGTLRRSGYYDRIIEMVAGRPVAKIDAPVRDVLRLAAHQLLSMRVAPHAAVHEAVQQVRSLGKSSASGFVNGVLRTITRTDREEWLHRVQGEAASEDDRLAVLHSHPVWIIGALRDALAAQGRESELTYLLDADNSPPRVGLVALPGLADRRTVSARLPNTEFSPIGLALAAGDPLDIAEVRAGTVRVQDEGSQLAALALSRARPVAAGERWLDLCAGPGGKTAVLAAEAAVHGAVVLANEVAPARAQLVRNAIAAVPGETRVLELDGRVVGPQNVGAFDRVLIDAPCTGLGALRRRPESRWRKSPDDVVELTRLQSELLESGLTALRPGGVLAYVTCSPHLAETRDIVAGALAAHPELRQLDTGRVLAEITDGALPAAAVGLAAQLWPHRHGTDAMFIALLTTAAHGDPSIETTMDTVDDEARGADRPDRSSDVTP
ncbi:RsmB/NOP family class I SAM-dependent RNA methyltransferase [Naasia lichenicola]|uniref:rRNA small subunit methyltransferase B n=1 Tax=Naasia lichenicola TaxID=2565933 RepID=A0A4S4FT11_9MICO|nr:transcription antitermination factor NusB [Naasia lichenicola]THG33062.1 rRNA small subunit methyltransferase B [Naasia lichenicola]